MRHSELLAYGNGFVAGRNPCPKSGTWGTRIVRRKATADPHSGMTTRKARTKTKAETYCVETYCAGVYCLGLWWS
jgi:hypothetical protein